MEDADIFFWWKHFFIRHHLIILSFKTKLNIFTVFVKNMSRKNALKDDICDLKTRKHLISKWSQFVKMKALQNPQTSHNLRHVTLNLYTSRSIVQRGLSLLIVNRIIDNLVANRFKIKVEYLVTWNVCIGFF